MDGRESLGMLFILFAVIFGFSFFVVSIIFYWRIVSRMGFPGVLSLLNLVPLINLVLLGYLAFAEWPVLLELRNLKGKQEESG